MISSAGYRLQDGGAQKRLVIWGASVEVHGLHL
jgi:hypothetical protein